jgi:beta-galactosidase
MPPAAPVRLTAAGGIQLPEGATATAWADAHVPERAETLLGYEHPHLGRWAAATTNAHGRGRVTYVGTLPDLEAAVALGRWLRPSPDAWEARPETVTVTSARNGEGDRVFFVSNWSWGPARVSVPVDVRDLLASGTLRVGGDLDLGPWDVRVLLEAPGEDLNKEGSSL